MRCELMNRCEQVGRSG